MTPFRRFVREIHERSVWQVLSIYLVAAWGALQVVEGITENAGLPDWVPPFALVLLVIGPPIVVSTAVVQRVCRSAGRRLHTRRRPTPAGIWPRGRAPWIGPPRAAPSWSGISPGGRRRATACGPRALERIRALEGR